MIKALIVFLNLFIFGLYHGEYNINNSENESFSEIEQNSNGLENFGVEEESPDLFSSNQEGFESEELSSKKSSEDQSEDDDLEIPAFLRRQKN